MSSSRRMRSLSSSFEHTPQLWPSQGRPISVGQLSWDGDLSSRVLDEEVLVDRLCKDVPEEALIWSTLSLELVLARLLRWTCKVNLSKFLRGVLSNGSIRSLWMRSFFTFAVSSFQCASLRGKKRFRTNHPNVTELSFITLPAFGPVCPVCLVSSRSSASRASDASFFSSPRT